MNKNREMLKPWMARNKILFLYLALFFLNIKYMMKKSLLKNLSSFL